MAKNNMVVVISEYGKSLLLMLFDIDNGKIMEQIPRIPSRLKVFEPRTLLIAISLEPCKDAVVLTASSGALVPQATIVKPIIRDETLKFFARAALPSTKISAPLTSIKKPTIRNKTLIIIVGIIDIRYKVQIKVL